MNHRLLFMYGYGLIELLAATGAVFLVMRACQTNPDGSVARLMRHRDRFWFGTVLLFVPAIVSHFFLLFLFRHSTFENPAPVSTVVAATARPIFNVFYGLIYGMAGCWFASPAKKEDRLNQWAALTVTVILMILTSGLLYLAGLFRLAVRVNLPVVFASAVSLAFLFWRAFRAEKPREQQDGVAESELQKTGYNPARAFLWLLVGLVPIPILLVVVSSDTPHPVSAVSVLIICAICNLCGGFGCLGGIKNTGTRIILGIFLSVFLFLLSWGVAILQACSHMNI